MAITFHSNSNKIISFDEFIYLTNEIIKFGNEDSLLKCNDVLLNLTNNRSFLIDFLNSQLKNELSSFQTNNNYTEQSFLLYDCNNFYVRATYWPVYSNIQSIKTEQDKIFAYNLAHDHNFALLTAGYHGDGYNTKIWDYDYSKVKGYEGEDVEMEFLEETNLCLKKAIYYIPNKDIHLQLPPKNEDSLAINIILKSHRQFNYRQYDFDIKNKKIKNVIFGSTSSKFGLLKLSSFINNDNTIELLIDLINKTKIVQVKEEALINLSKIVKKEDVIFNIIKNNKNLIDFYELKIKKK